MTSSKVNRRRFLKYAGAASAVVGASAIGLDYLASKSTSNQRSLISLTESTSKTPTTQTTSEVLATESSTTQTSSTSINGEFVRLQGDKFLYKNRLFKLKGFNYYPRDFGWRIFEAWDEDKKEVDFELYLAQDLNCNCLRTFVNYQYSTDNVNYQYGKDYVDLDPAYVDHVKEFLAVADEYGLKVILSLFEYVYWDLFDPRYHELGIEYLDQLIPSFSSDPRIFAWDVINEPDLKGPFSQPNGKENVTGFLTKMTDRIRELDKNHPITIGIGKSEHLVELKDAVQNLDFVSFHDYDDPRKLLQKISDAKKFGKPVVLEEFGRYTYPKDPVWPQTEADQADYYASALPVVKETDMAGSLFWDLMDFPVANRPDITMGPVYDGKDNKEHHFGIYRIDYTPKPAKRVIQRFYSSM